MPIPGKAAESAGNSLSDQRLRERGMDPSNIFEASTRSPCALASLAGSYGGFHNVIRASLRRWEASNPGVHGWENALINSRTVAFEHGRITGPQLCQLIDSLAYRADLMRMVWGYVGVLGLHPYTHPDAHNVGQWLSERKLAGGEHARFQDTLRAIAAANILPGPEVTEHKNEGRKYSKGMDYLVALFLD